LHLILSFLNHFPAISVLFYPISNRIVPVFALHFTHQFVLHSTGRTARFDILPNLFSRIFESIFSTPRPSRLHRHHSEEGDRWPPPLNDDAKASLRGAPPGRDAAISFPSSEQAISIPCKPGRPSSGSECRIRGVPPRNQLPTPPPAPPSGRGRRARCRTIHRFRRWNGFSKFEMHDAPLTTSNCVTLRRTFRSDVRVLFPLTHPNEKDDRFRQRK